VKIEYTLDEINNVAKTIIEHLQQNKEVKVLAFYGKMGSGKTTLIKEICANFKVIDEVTSPTFAIINEYNTQNGDFVYHFDFYRLKNIQEAIDIATEDYFYSNYYCLLEWPEIVEPILPDNIINIKITEINDNKREITFN